MSPIKQFSINYDPINEENTFSSGDIIEGQVVLEVKKEVKIDRLYIKCKGEANVRWTESNSDDTESTYSDCERYFKLKQIFIRDNSKQEKDKGVVLVSGEIYNNLVSPGSYVFPFRFQLPQGNLPMSFKGAHGSIAYTLEARLSRSWKTRTTAQKEFTFVSKIQEDGAELMKPLAGTVEKKMKLFTSGSASLKAMTDKKGYMKGEIIMVEANIENSSSRDLKLKYKLQQRQTFTAKSSHNYSTKDIFKEIGDPVPSRSKRTVTKELQIPCNTEETISNCRIIKVEYNLKVYLDVPYASDPEILFPVVILPADQYFPPLQNQPHFNSCGKTGEPAWNRFPDQPALDPYPPLTAACGTATNLDPSLYTPEAPPPSYADIYPNSSGYQFPTTTAGCPPSYSKNECPAQAAPSGPQHH